MKDETIYCTCCEKPLITGNEVWLELSFETNRVYLPPNKCPAEESQGAFPYGKTCAAKLLKHQ